MHEAVIVSTATDPDRDGVQGIAPRRRRLRVGHPRGGRVGPAGRHRPGAGRRRGAGGEPLRRRGHRPFSAIEAGLVHAPGVAHNRHCASSLAAVQSAAASIRAGMDRVVVAGGAHSQSTSPRSTRRIPGTDDWTDWMSPSHRDSPDAPNMDMSITVGWNAAVSAGVTREEMDAWALRSHQRAVAAIDAGRFEDEIAPLDVKRRDGSTATFAVDEHPRRDTSMEKLASLKPLHPEIEGFSITAGNAAGANDGAAAMVMVDRGAGRGARSRAAGHGDGVGLRRGSAARHRPGPHHRHPQGPRARRPHRRRRGPLGDQRGVRLDVRGHHPDPRDRRVDRECPRERLQPRPPHRHDRRPHGHLTGPRAPSPGRRYRGGGHVRRRRHVHRGGARGAGRLAATPARMPRWPAPGSRLRSYRNSTVGKKKYVLIGRLQRREDLGACASA